MAAPPNRLQIPTTWEQAIPLINDNFNQVASDLSDLGAKVTVSTTITIPAVSGAFSKSVNLISSEAAALSTSYVRTLSPVTAVSYLSATCDVYIDNDNNNNYLWPAAPSITGDLVNFIPMCHTNFSPSVAGSLGTIVVGGWNFGASPHTYYIHVSIGYIPYRTGTFK